MSHKGTQYTATPMKVTVYCDRCGKSEIILLDELGDYVYLDDVLDELGWKDHNCPNCVRKISNG